ncbi:glutamate 5-kinase [Sphingomonas jejuensis]|uniref:Glutamate 5-kinase n=1 Tax=Sphingomonas jejuensis TaxID=904715 RepID=A0ABX0XLL5_9SPHN|nr:glutamate 5-kinase [Sphingomonas jejuensis]NJC33677.1 glutamate 5-kinase [Sphingomonas jejuensis]
MTDTPSPASALAGARRIVIKVGSSLLIGSDGAVAGGWLRSLAEDLAALRSEGRELILVTSGAVALGRGDVGGVTDRLADKQAAAAIGQSRLMQAWSDTLGAHGVVGAQLLLSPDDTERRRRWLNARATVEALIGHGVLPIVNENDTVATEELRYGDNDRLAARTAQLARADLLVLLSDIDGLYSTDPRRDPAARHLPIVDALTPEVMAMAGGPNQAAGVGTGGMATKLAAAAIARSAGCATIIADGTVERPLAAIRAGARATLVTARATPMAAYKQWIAGSLAVAGELRIDRGAAAALDEGRSLLAAGISGVEGRFGKGDCVRLVGPGGVLGLGISGYGSEAVLKIMGRRSDEAAAVLGYRGPAAVVHRDDMVLEAGR